MFQLSPRVVVSKKVIALFLLAVTAGSMAFLFLNRMQQSGVSGSGPVSAVPVEPARENDLTPPRVEVSPQLTAPPDNNGEDGPQAALIGDTTLPLEQTRATEKAIERFKVMVDRAEDPHLRAAGFSEERIAWIRQRSEELQKERERAEIERKQRGDPLPSLNSVMAYRYDKDLDLRREIGDEEYDRYRQAQGRPTSVRVIEFRAGSNAEKAGIQVGDQIVSYGGRRVYNAPELEALTEQNSSDAVVVEVERSGRTLQITLPKGTLGIRGPTMMESEPNPFRPPPGG